MIELIVVEEVLLSHELLMPADHSIDIRHLNSCEISDLSENHESVGDIFPEDSPINVRDDSAFHFLNWDFNCRVTFVRSKRGVHVRAISDLLSILFDNAVFEREDLREVDFRVEFSDLIANQLNFTVKQIELQRRELVHVFVE